MTGVWTSRDGLDLSNWTYTPQLKEKNIHKMVLIRGLEHPYSKLTSQKCFLLVFDGRPEANSASLTRMQAVDRLKTQNGDAVELLMVPIPR